MLFIWVNGYFYSGGIIFRDLWEFYYYIHWYGYYVLLLYIGKDIDKDNFIPPRKITFIAANVGIGVLYYILLYMYK